MTERCRSLSSSYLGKLCCPNAPAWPGSSCFDGCFFAWLTKKLPSSAYPWRCFSALQLGLKQGQPICLQGLRHWGMTLQRKADSLGVHRDLNRISRWGQNCIWTSKMGSQPGLTLPVKNCNFESRRYAAAASVSYHWRFSRREARPCISFISI